MGNISQVIEIRPNTYSVRISHRELGLSEDIQGYDKATLIKEAKQRVGAWDNIWKKQSVVIKAERMNLEARQTLLEYENLLKNGISADVTFKQDSKKNDSKFKLRKPREPEQESPPAIKRYPPKPNRDSPEFKVDLTLFDKLSSSRTKIKQEQAEEKFNQAIERWERSKEDIDDKYKKELIQYDLEFQERQLKYKEKLEQWERKREKFLQENKRNKQKIQAQIERLRNGDKKAVCDYIKRVLQNSVYPKSFPKIFSLDFNQGNRSLIVDYQCPSVDEIPFVESVRLDKEKEEFIHVPLAITKKNQLYDSMLYQISLRTIYEIYSSDKAKTIEIVIFNGYVRSISKATGRTINPCVLSLQVSKQEFKQINFKNVDPKACFKQLKGIGSSKLHTITAVAPLAKIDRTDKRFVKSYEVESGLTEGENLALIDWQDFENLVRELFEKEFGGPDNEVKITRASRDAGVDAVVFDADPIRGGKIVVQAKRYTNTVNVSAVRDLYGTVLNEGAMKGILVTTSDYGPDAYDFAKGKPITLLNGNNLLFMLEKHGHKASIDLKEAKRLLAESEKKKK